LAIASEIPINDQYLSLEKPLSAIQADPHTIVALRDVPIGTDKEQIRAALSQFGSIINIKQQIINKWAYTKVQFETSEQANNASNTWSILLGTDRIRILPIINQHKVLTERDTYSAKLVNLPWGTTAFELNDLLLQIKGKTCFIPRSPIKYNRQRFAIISFENETDLASAMTKNFILRETKLWWELPSTRPCRICFSKDHITNECTYKNQKAHYFNRLNKLYENQHITYRKPIITSPTLNYKRPSTNIPKQNKSLNYISNSSALLEKDKQTSPHNLIKQDTFSNQIKEDIEKLTNNLNLLNDRFIKLEEKLNLLISNTSPKLPLIPEMPIFTSDHSDQLSNHNIQFTPLQSNSHLQETTSAHTTLNQQLQQQLDDKNEEITVLKNNNLLLNQQITKLNKDQVNLIERMNQLEKFLSHDSTK
jgi:hypothetical protein